MDNQYSNPNFEILFKKLLKDRKKANGFYSANDCNALESYGELLDLTVREKALFTCFLIEYPLVSDYDKSVFRTFFTDFNLGL